MSRKRTVKQPVPAMQASPVEAQPEAIEREGDAVIRLLVPRLNAHRVLCPAGMVIAPDVDGWPEHRVGIHLRHGYADVVAE